MPAQRAIERLREFFPVLWEIVEWHERGTRYHIRVDPTDGLLYAGEPGVQLTGMDAKVGNWVVTPCIGKPVEINALWYNALCSMAEFAHRPGEPADHYDALAKQARAGYARFWNEEMEYCYDVVDVCVRHLLTSHGLRSLAPGDPAYAGHHSGDQRQRDAAYHQGIVWGRLIGPFVSAHLRVIGDRERARSFLEPLVRDLADHGLGSFSEISDGDPPFAPRGCIAQAWSVAEVLRAWRKTAG